MTTRTKLLFELCRYFVMPALLMVKLEFESVAAKLFVLKDHIASAGALQEEING